MEASRNLLKSQHGKDPRRSTSVPRSRRAHLDPTSAQVGWFWEEEELVLKALLCFCGGGEWAEPWRGISQVWDCCPSSQLSPLCICSTCLFPWCHSAGWILSLQFGICPRRDSCRQNSLGTHSFLRPPHEPSALSLCPPPVHSPPPGGAMRVPVLPDLASLSLWGEWRED